MKRFSFIILVLSLLICASCAPPAADSTPAPSEAPPTVEVTVSPEPEPPAPTVATLAVCGDAMSHLPLTNDAWNAELGEYDFVRIMAAAQPYVSAADYAVCNLETTLAGGPEYSGYPCFNAPDAMAYGLKEVGFDLCLTANNHSLDKRLSGLKRTLDVLDEVGLAHVGTSRSAEEQENNCVLADVGGIKVAFLGYTYGTNGIPYPSDDSYCINLFNTDYLTTLCTADYDRLAADLDAAEALEPDMIVVMMHWGVEYQLKQNSYQDELADFLLTNGADIILGGHSHVPQPMELRTVTDADGNEHQGFVCFSLGNFFSSQNYTYTDTTAVLTLELTRDNVTGNSSVTGYSYVPMYMLDREKGASPRFELLDSYAALADENTSAELAERITTSIETCHTVFGAEYDAMMSAD